MARRLLLITLTTLALAGCSFFTARPVRYFDIQPTPGKPVPGPKLPTVLVPDFNSATPYDRLRLVIRKSIVELQADRTLQWVSVPGRMLAQGLRSRLEATERFENVRREASPRPPYVVEGRVEALEIDDVSDTARLKVRLSIRRTDDGVLIDQTTVDEQHPANGHKPSEAILVLRDIYSQQLDGLTERIINVLQQDVQRTAARGKGAADTRSGPQ
jgi:ABC-type uncharacterized transport system auxiliary subunit